MTSQTENTADRADPQLSARKKTPSGLVSVRHETDDDSLWIDDLHARVFGPGRFARTAFRVREQFPTDPELSLLAEIDGQRAGSVWMTPISLSGVNGYLLGPLATDPAQRNRGVGRALVGAATKAGMAKENIEFVVLVGDACYYKPLGFRLSKPGSIIFPGPVDPARILVHCPGGAFGDSVTGQIAAFREL